MHVMPVIFLSFRPALRRVPCDKGSLAVPAADLCVVRSDDRFGGLVVRVGVPLADVYLEFLGGRRQPNTVLAAAYDLKVFFSVVGKPPDQVRPADVLAFITAQRTGRAGERGVLQPVVDSGHEPAGVSAATVRRRLSIVSGFFAFQAGRRRCRYCRYSHPDIKVHAFAWRAGPAQGGG
jgi:hypothetical protein